MLFYLRTILFSLLLWVLLCSAGIFPQAVQAQQPPIHTYFESSVAAGSNDLPFWLYANRYGQLDPGSSFNSLSLLSVEKPFTSGSTPLNYTLGATTAFRLSDTSNTLHLQQLYGGLEYGIFRLQLGRFYDDAEMLHPGLSTGSMMLSRNATPHPRLMLTTRGFIDVPYTSGAVQFRGMYGDGVLENDRVVSRTLLHQKSLHLKFNFYDIELVTGFIHNVMWGGKDQERGQVPQGLSDYLRVVLSRSAAPGSGALDEEEINKLGNTVAAYDGALTIPVGGADLIAYRQIYLEDTVSLRLRSYMDGLYGIGLTNITWTPLLDSILFEHVDTIMQDSQDGYPRGRANYYNHYVYQSGWSYHGSALGNPLLSYSREMGRFNNNMILGWHMGIAGNPADRFSYKIKTTYTRNYGTCRDDLLIDGSCFISQVVPPSENFQARSRSEVRRDQFALMLNASYELVPEYGITIFGTLAGDTGDFSGNRLGFMAGITIRDFHTRLRR